MYLGRDEMLLCESERRWMFWSLARESGILDM